MGDSYRTKKEGEAREPQKGGPGAKKLAGGRKQGLTISAICTIHSLNTGRRGSVTSHSL